MVPPHESEAVPHFLVPHAAALVNGAQTHLLVLSQSFPAPHDGQVTVPPHPLEMVPHLLVQSEVGTQTHLPLLQVFPAVQVPQLMLLTSQRGLAVPHSTFKEEQVLQAGLVET